jgi:hypothetical protein
MDALFRLPDAAREDPRIDAWLAGQPPELRAIGASWVERLRACGPDVREILHDGLATACVGDAAFAYVGVFRAHVSVGFFRGAELEDPRGLLEGTSQRMRHVKLRPGAEVDEEAVAALVGRAYADMRRRVAEAREDEGGAAGAHPRTRRRSKKG